MVYLIDFLYQIMNLRVFNEQISSNVQPKLIEFNEEDTYVFENVKNLLSDIPQILGQKYPEDAC